MCIWMWLWNFIGHQHTYSHKNPSLPQFISFSCVETSNFGIFQSRSPNSFKASNVNAMVLLHKDPNAAIVTQPALYFDGTWHIQWGKKWMGNIRAGGAYTQYLCLNIIPLKPVFERTVVKTNARSINLSTYKLILFKEYALCTFSLVYVFWNTKHKISLAWIHIREFKPTFSV